MNSITPTPPAPVGTAQKPKEWEVQAVQETARSGYFFIRLKEGDANSPLVVNERLFSWYDPAGIEEARSYAEAVCLGLNLKEKNLNPFLPVVSPC